MKLADLIKQLVAEASTLCQPKSQGASFDAIRQRVVMGARVAVLPSFHALAEALRDPEFVIRRIDYPCRHPRDNLALAAQFSRGGIGRWSECVLAH